tara:strand:- start:57 stop:278 length:222 start_codon:yes stop_codon:yes gene_type:complete
LVLLDQTQDLLADLPEQVVLVVFVRQVEQLAVEQAVLVVELLPLELELVQVEPLELAVQLVLVLRHHATGMPR